MGKEETGKHIDGYSDYYVSNLGRIRSVKYGKERILKQVYCKSGYMYVQLCYNGKVKSYIVHRLVAKAFIPNPEGLPQINHIDENPCNNVVSNLEGCDAAYNINFGTANKRRSDTLLNNRDKSKAVKQLSLNGEVLATYPSVHQAARISGLTASAIWMCAKGIIKNPKQFKWEFVS